MIEKLAIYFIFLLVIPDIYIYKLFIVYKHKNKHGISPTDVPDCCGSCRRLS